MTKSNRISAKQYRQMAPKTRVRVDANGFAKPTLRYEEHKMQVALFVKINTNVTKYPHWKTIYAVPNASRRSPQQGKRMKDEGMRAGIPDVVCPFPRGGYSALYIEMKVRGNYPSKAQKEMIELLRKNGNRVEVCYSTDAAYDVLVDYEHSSDKADVMRERYLGVAKTITNDPY